MTNRSLSTIEEEEGSLDPYDIDGDNLEESPEKDLCVQHLEAGLREVLGQATLDQVSRVQLMVGLPLPQDNLCWVKVLTLEGKGLYKM